MQEFIDALKIYWPDLIYGFLMVLCYFFIMIFKHSSKNLNTNLKTAFKENSDYIYAKNEEYIAHLNKQIEEANAKYESAVKLCEEYQNKVFLFEQTLKEFLCEEDKK